MMNPSFSREEKLFVLAEMIKASRIDIDSLIRFIKYHNIEPDWMSMQIPLGRNMNQCMQFAEHISIATTPLKRRPSDDFDHPSKRLAFSDLPEQARPTSSPGILQPATAPPQAPTFAMQARSLNGALESPPQHPAPPPVKKRGRPSRADKAKRDLRPLLPQHLAPRPPPGAISQVMSPNAPRPILPAITSPPALHGMPVEPRSWSPPTTSKAPSGVDGESSDKKRDNPEGEAPRRHLSVDEASGVVCRMPPFTSLERSPPTSIRHQTAMAEMPARLSPRETTAIYDDQAKTKSSLPAVSPLIRKLPLPLSNPA